MNESSHVPRSHAVLAAGAVAMLAFASIWLRWPGFTEGGFASHDVAGILYNAMVLGDGELPYVATAELKAPGSFYLATLFAAPGGTNIAAFQVWANAWAVASLLVVGLIAWRIRGPYAAVAAVFVYALHDAHLDSMDANYVTWANLPQIVAMGLGFEAVRLRKRGAITAWIACGVMVGAAALLKRPAGLVVLVVLPWAFMHRQARRDGLVMAASVLGGVALAFLPIALHYASQGHLIDFVTGYFFNPWGSRYVGVGVEARRIGLLSGAREGLLATVFFLALPAFLAAFAVGLRRDETNTVLLAWVVVTLLAASIGLRFYKGYFLAPLAPLCLLAASPWGLFGREGRIPGWLRWLLVVPAVALSMRAVWMVDVVRRDRARPHDEGGRTIADHVAANTEPDDRVWFWGWHLWDAYVYADRRSASRIYKSLGLLTTPNDDTWRTRASRLEYVESDASKILLQDFEATPPAYVVLGSTVPHRDFGELQRYLKAHYRRDRRVRLGRVEFWRRRDDKSTGDSNGPADSGSD